MRNLVLYYFPECPYCQKVLNFMQANNIKATLKNTREKEQYRQELIKVGGKSQVPCLFVDGKPLYESDDIIHWLDTNR